MSITEQALWERDRLNQQIEELTSSFKSLRTHELIKKLEELLKFAQWVDRVEAEVPDRDPALE